MRPFELWVGLRYTRAKRRNHFISFISLTSMLGIALGVAALIVVLSVMNGFQKELRSRILGVAAHAEVLADSGRMTEWPEVAALAARHPSVVGTAPFVQGQGMLSVGEKVQGVMVRGILPGREERVAEIGSHMKSGRLADLRPGEFGIVLGAEVARAVGVAVGDRVVMITPQGQMTPAGMLPRLKQLTVVGVFEMGMYEYDAGMAFLHLQDASALYRLGGGVTGVRLKVGDLFEAPRVATALAQQLPPSYYVVDWTMRHANFFRAIQIEKNVMFIILLLIVAVAAFNIVSTLVMAVQDKRADIAILRTLGASPRSIMALFMIQGSVIGLVGTLLGLAGGIALALNIDVIVPAIERMLGMSFLSKDIYFISELPSDLQGTDVVTVATVSFVLTFIATLYPSWRASRTQPAEALRYE